MKFEEARKNLILDLRILEKFKDMFELAAQLRACGIYLVADEKTIAVLKSLNTDEANICLGNLLSKNDFLLKNKDVKN